MEDSTVNNNTNPVCREVVHKGKLVFIGVKMFEELLACTTDEMYEKAETLAETLSSEERAKE